MRKLLSLIPAILLGTYILNAASIPADHAPIDRYDYGSSFIFVENGITFSVFPDGEFDFYIDNPNYFGASISSGNVNISFNSGYRYDAYIQYDDYGAVLQIENTPIYYDFYGRVSRIGSVNIYYNSGRLARIGDLYIHYNPYGVYTHYTGYINVYNRRYIYRPYHRYLVRPYTNYCIVNYKPYRRYYTPVRYSYYKPYKNNYRKAYATVGRTYHYRENPSRAKIYRNDKRVSSRNDSAIAGDIRKRSLETESRRKTEGSRNSNVYDSRRSSNNNVGSRSEREMNTSRNSGSSRGTQNKDVRSKNESVKYPASRTKNSSQGSGRSGQRENPNQGKNNDHQRSSKASSSDHSSNGRSSGNSGGRGRSNI